MWDAVRKTGFYIFFGLLNILDNVKRQLHYSFGVVSYLL